MAAIWRIDRRGQERAGRLFRKLIKVYGLRMELTFHERKEDFRTSMFAEEDEEFTFGYDKFMPIRYTNIENMNQQSWGVGREG